ncbi:ImmA/IrrE family metallo-endopeptidase [Pontibacter sp. 13R65]|uniref:ImmA/IrrE family metallo-endopeptidase n=1 Tax=Pontibacter sp. 13R65 TaxID=3127458 RepID=UPI00301D4CD1
MGLNNYPENKLARKVIAKHSLKVPFNLEDLVQQYAKLIYKSIPIDGVDGVSINLKVPGKKPTIVLNTDASKTRQKFTLAHELGHIIIPWHIGTIVDNIYNDSYKNYEYSLKEQQANRFASELLMPFEWIIDEYEEFKDDLSSLHQRIAVQAGVSLQASAIRLIQVLPSNIVYTAEKFGMIVLHSGKTEGTNTFVQDSGMIFKENFYPYVDSYTVCGTSSETYHWWKISSEVFIDAEDQRVWQEILDNIIHDIQPNDDIEYFRKKVVGIMSFAHGKVKSTGDYNVNTVVAACIHRLRRSELDDLTQHKDFEKFVKIRCQAFFDKNKKPKKK